MNTSEKKWGSLKNPSKLATLSEEKERELLEMLLENSDIGFCSVPSGIENPEPDAQDLYVDIKQLPYAKQLLEQCHAEYLILNRFKEEKRRMMEPTPLVTVEVGKPFMDIETLLIEHDIHYYYETEQYYQAGKYTPAAPRNGHEVILRHFFVDRPDVERVMQLMEEYQKEYEELNEAEADLEAESCEEEADWTNEPNSNSLLLTCVLGIAVITILIILASFI